MKYFRWLPGVSFAGHSPKIFCVGGSTNEERDSRDVMLGRTLHDEIVALADAEWCKRPVMIRHLLALGLKIEKMERASAAAFAP